MCIHLWTLFGYFLRLHSWKCNCQDKTHVTCLRLLLHVAKLMPPLQKLPVDTSPAVYGRASFCIPVATFDITSAPTEQWLKNHKRMGESMCGQGDWSHLASHSSPLDLSLLCKVSEGHNNQQVLQQHGPGTVGLPTHGLAPLRGFLLLSVSRSQGIVPTTHPGGTPSPSSGQSPIAWRGKSGLAPLLQEALEGEHDTHTSLRFPRELSFHRHPCGPHLGSPLALCAGLLKVWGFFVSKFGRKSVPSLSNPQSSSQTTEPGER